MLWRIPAKPEYGELAHNHSLLGATNETLARSR